MLVLLAAIVEGLAAGVYGVPVEEEARWRELLGIPADSASSPARPSDGLLPDPGVEQGDEPGDAAAPDAEEPSAGTAGRSRRPRTLTTIGR